MVECIVRISANLQSDLFPDSKCLAKRQIDPAERGTSQRITAFVAEGSGGWDCVGGLVEPMIEASPQLALCCPNNGVQMPG